jgi:hypothetical protein
VRSLRWPDGADGLVLHVPRLRHEHRLQLKRDATHYFEAPQPRGFVVRAGAHDRE